MDIIALGPEDAGLLTLGAIERIKSAKKVILRTGRHGAAEYLKSIGVSFETMDALYDQAEDFDELSEKIAESVQKAAEEENDLCYCVSDPSKDESVAAILKSGVSARVFPGVSLADTACAQAAEAGLKAQGGLCTVTAMDVANLRIEPSQNLLVTELNSRLGAGEVKLRLLEVYPAEKKVLFGKSVIALEDLDRQKNYDHLSFVFVPESPLEERERYVFSDLLTVMDRLRAPGEGCPWDLEQTHESLSQYLVEEAYEVLDTIRQDDPDRLADELGDVLFQVVFHSRVGWEFGEFDIGDVTTNICRKMISRHPHIFAEDSCSNSKEVLESWENIKKQEKGLKSVAEVLNDVPRTLPALTRSGKLQTKSHIDMRQDAYLKELSELSKAYAQEDENRKAIISRMLFLCAGLSRMAEVEPEMALDEYNQQFIGRFEKDGQV